DGVKTVMVGFMQKYGVDGIELKDAHNVDMGLGAIEAIEAAAAIPGDMLKIRTIKAFYNARETLVWSEIKYIVACNAPHDEEAAEIVKAVLAGETVDKRTIVEDQAFDQAAAKEALPNRAY